MGDVPGVSAPQGQPNYCVRNPKDQSTTCDYGIGGKITFFYSGGSVISLPDGSLRSVTRYPTGPIAHQILFLGDDDLISRKTQYRDGSLVTEYRDGRIETQFPPNNKLKIKTVTEYPAGAVKYETEYLDGTIVRDHTDGKKETRYRDRKIEIEWPEGDKVKSITVYPRRNTMNIGIIIRYADGTIETVYSNGKIIFDFPPDPLRYPFRSTIKHPNGVVEYINHEGNIPEVLSGNKKSGSKKTAGETEAPPKPLTDAAIQACTDNLINLYDMSPEALAEIGPDQILAPLKNINNGPIQIMESPAPENPEE